MFVALAVWFLFKDNKQYYNQLRIVKNGAVFGIFVPLISCILGFVVGFCGYFVGM